MARAQRDPRELAHEVGLLVGQRRAGEDREGVAAVRLLDAPDRRGDAVHRVVPSDRAKALAFDADERAAQPIRVLVLHVPLDTLRAELAAIERELLPRLEADDLLVLDAKL